ncbi:aldehyde dehydrogenase family protein [Streptomyces sp. URMC 128]|uniref:aldehyde dehydrogenase family protein n=1 Tax=Streptomyces sp. URMC 128 TaxID=3423404 RepID=UPI003F1CFC31
MLLAECAGTGRTYLDEAGRQRAVHRLDDADLDLAVDGAMVAKMLTMGEACTAANRFFVHRSVADEFARRLAERMGALVVGPGTRRGANVGPLIDAGARAKVELFVADAAARRARLLIGGRAPLGPGWLLLSAAAPP